MTDRKYRVRLESQTDGQWREITLSRVPCASCGNDPLVRDGIPGVSLPCAACEGRGDEPATPESARAHCERYEHAHVAYTLDRDPYLSPEQRTACEGGYLIDEAGKVRLNHAFWADNPALQPNKRLKAKAHLHQQDKPYQVVLVEEVPVDAGRLINELARLHHDPKAWKRMLQELHEAGVPLAAVTAYMFGVPVKNQYDGTAVVDWDTNTIKVALTTSSYTDNQDTHDFFDDVTNEVSGTGYTAGGATLASAAATYDTASDQARLDAADTTWTTSTITARKAPIYKSTGTASTSPLMGLVDFGADVSTTAGTFQITWDSTGIVVIDVT